MAKRSGVRKLGYQCICSSGQGDKRSGIGENCRCKRLNKALLGDVNAKPVYMKKVIVMW